MNKQFVYIDSSQEEDNSVFLKPAVHPDDKQQQQTQKYYHKSPKHRGCLAHNPQTHLLATTPYEQLVKNLLNDKISQQMKKQLITNIEDVQLVSNINKRNLNYEYFIKKMEIDQKYRALQQEKADRLKRENQERKKVLYKHQSQQQMKDQELELKKFVVEKKQKQERVVEHVKKEVRKLGFERIYNAHKKMKEQLRNKQIEKQNEMASRLNKQRNEILELQEEYEAVKQAKRINKLEQRKVIKELSQKIQNEKQGLNVKLTKKKAFQV